MQSSFFVYDMIRFYEGETRGVVTSYAHSGGAIVLQACAERWAYPHASLLVHYGTIYEGGYLREDFLDRKKAKQNADLLTYGRDRLEEILIVRSKKSRRVIRNLCHRDIEISAKEALRLNLLDNILKPPSR
jgi:ATP-dependent protease ClpP protease subunit